MKKTILVLLAFLLMPITLFASPYGYRDYMRPYGEGTAVFKQDNVTIFLNTDIQVQLARPMGVSSTTNTIISYNDAEIKTTVKYDLGDGDYVVGHADIDAYRGVGTALYRTEPQAVGDDVWVGIGNKNILLKIGRFATPSSYAGASMAVEGPQSGIFSRGLYPILQSDQSIGLYTYPAKGWMINGVYIIENEFTPTKGGSYDIAVTHFTTDGLYFQGFLQHESVVFDPVTQKAAALYCLPTSSYSAYGLTGAYKPKTLGLSASWSNRENDAQVYEATLIKDISIGNGDAFTLHVGYGYKNYNAVTTKDISGWYGNVMYVLPQAKNVNVFAQISSTDETVSGVKTGLGFVTGMRITL